MATLTARVPAFADGLATALKLACIPAALALAACNNSPPPPPAPQVIEHTRVVEQPVVEQPSVTIDVHAHDAHHDDDERRRREEEEHHHDDHPH